MPESKERYSNSSDDSSNSTSDSSTEEEDDDEENVFGWLGKTKKAKKNMKSVSEKQQLTLHTPTRRNSNTAMITASTGDVSSKRINRSGVVNNLPIVKQKRGRTNLVSTPDVQTQKPKKGPRRNDNDEDEVEEEKKYEPTVKSHAVWTTKLV